MEPLGPGKDFRGVFPELRVLSAGTCHLASLLQLVFRVRLQAIPGAVILRRWLLSGDVCVLRLLK